MHNQLTVPKAVLITALTCATHVAAAPNIQGTWILFGAEDFSSPARTELNSQLQQGYDFAHDDPSLFCIPASWTRVYSNPNTPLEIVQEEGRVTIAYELYDIRRSIPLIAPGDAPKYQPADPNYPTLGSNVGWYEGEDLVVHSNNYGDQYRVLTTIRQAAGLHQSPLMVTEERYRRLSNNELLLVISHFDPLMYSQPFVTTYELDQESTWEVAPYNCEPEEAAVNSLAHTTGDTTNE